MCKYCETVKHTGGKVGNSAKYELMENLPIIDEYSEQAIVPDGENPVQYIRKYRDKFCLITELADGDGTVLLLPINNCPICGRKLGKQN